MRSTASVLLVAAMVMVTVCIGAGVAKDYSASTDNSGNSLQANYIVLELNDNGVTPQQGTFQFDNLVYYRDRIVTSSGVVDIYTSTSIDSDPVKVFIRSTGSAPSGNMPLTVKLNSAVNDATIKIQFFTDQACTQPYPVPAQGQDPTIITLTMTEQTVGSFAADTDYWCKISVTVITSVLDTALTPSAAEQRPGDGKGSISFGVTFMATAESAM